MVVHLDTSVLIEFSRTQGRGYLPEILIEKSRGSLKVAISTVVIFEFFQGASLSDPAVAKQARKIWQYFDILPVTEDVAELAGTLIRTRQIGSDEGFDALIAATAIQQNAQLVTLNKKHFRNVKGLKFWHSKKMILNDKDWTKSFYGK